MRRFTGILLSVLLTVSCLFGSFTAAAADASGTFIGPESDVLVEGDYELTGGWTAMVSNADICQGIVFYYTDVRETGTQWLSWYPSAGNYATAAVALYIQNLSGAPVSFKDRVTAVLEYEDAGEVKSIDCTYQQWNPGQVDNTGYEIYSEDCVEIPAGEKTQIRLIADVPYEFHQMAVDRNNTDLLIARVFIDGAEYDVDFHGMELNGYGDSDADRILQTVLRIREDSVGQDVLAAKFAGDPTLAATGIDAAEYAGKLSRRFTTLLSDVSVDGDTAEVTLYITTPDFIRMYEELSKQSDARFEEIGKDNITQEMFAEIMGQLFLNFPDSVDFPTNDEEFHMTFTRNSDGSWQSEQTDELTTKLRTPLINM